MVKFNVCGVFAAFPMFNAVKNARKKPARLRSVLRALTRSEAAPLIFLPASRVFRLAKPNPPDCYYARQRFDQCRCPAAVGSDDGRYFPSGDRQHTDIDLVRCRRLNVAFPTCFDRIYENENRYQYTTVKLDFQPFTKFPFIVPPPSFANCSSQYCSKKASRCFNSTRGSGCSL